MVDGAATGWLVAYVDRAPVSAQRDGIVIVIWCKRFSERILLPEHDQTIRGCVRERFQKDGVADAENGGVGADTEPDGDDGDCRESGALSQAASGVAQILPESIQRRESSL